jgi:hypothetical protein
MDKSETPRHDCRSCRYLTLRRGVLDLSIIQGPFSVAPCQTLISRFATFSSLYGLSEGVREGVRGSTAMRKLRIDRFGFHIVVRR